MKCKKYPNEAKVTANAGPGGSGVGFIGRRKTGLMGGVAATREMEQAKRARETECRTIKGKEE